MLKPFQRIIFACLKEFFMFKLYRILQWFRFFTIFLFEISVYFKFESSNTIVRCCQGFPGCCDFGLHISISNSFRLVDRAIFEIFQKFLEKFNFRKI